LEREKPTEIIGLQAFIISLGDPRNPNLIEQLRIQGISTELVKAVDGRQWNFPFEPKLVNTKRFKRVMNRLPAGAEIGCALSHLEVAKKAKKYNLNYALVFEDDADIVADLLPAVIQLASLDSDKPAVLQIHSYRLSTLRKNTVSRSVINSQDTVGRFFIPPFSAAAYCMNRAAIEIYAARETVEGVADWPPFAYGFDFWGYFPSPVQLIGGDSTIESFWEQVKPRLRIQNKYFVMLSTYARLFRIGTVFEYSASLGGLKIYAKRVIVPHTVYLMRYFCSRTYRAGPDEFRVR
jgi:hypothetical protein